MHSTPITNEKNIRAYLHDNPSELFKWTNFINGNVKLTFDDIEGMTAPELSVLQYCMKKRAKYQAKFYQNLLGGDQ